MLNDYDFAYLACRASNLSERLSLVEKLNKSKTLQPAKQQLNSLDTWRINKITNKLAATQVKQQLYQQLASYIPSKNDLLKRLKQYKLYEQNLKIFSPKQINFFFEAHHWLETYKSALKILSSPPKDKSSYWYKSDIYYGRFAKVCEPFLLLLENKLRWTYLDSKINPQLISDIQFHLINRFEKAIARAIEADINIYSHQNNKTNSSDEAAYINYMEERFNDEIKYHNFYCMFPVLTRWLAEITNFLSLFSEELIRRLTRDFDEISETFFPEKKIIRIESLQLGKSDPHAGGKTVVIVELQLSNCERRKIVYKPRSLECEQSLQSLVTFLRTEQVIDFGCYRVISKKNYGYAEFLTVKNKTKSKEIVRKFYEQLGGYLAIFHILGGSDLHHENLIVSQYQPFICDCETVLEILPYRMDKSTDTLLDSVFSTGMLDVPLNNINQSNRISITGYNGGESYYTPFAVPTINNRMSLNLTVKSRKGVKVEVEGNNRIYYDNELIEPQEYQDSIVCGFNQVYNWMRENQTKAKQAIEKLFASCSIRFVNRATQVYASLINSIQHSKCLSDPLEVDLVFHSLIEHPRLWDDEGKLAELEIRSLWQLDIPIFTTNADSKSLIYNYQEFLESTLSITPQQNAIARIKRLSLESQKRQNQYIYTSLSGGEINNQHFVSSAVNYAEQIGWQLCSLLQNSEESSFWKTIQYTQTGRNLVNVNSSLYNGSAGIGLFLAYLDTVNPRAEFRQAAEAAMTHALDCSNDQEIGAFVGKSGLIYLLTHLGILWEKSELLDRAVELSAEIKPQIQKSRYYDIIQGLAGVIPVMLGLTKVTGSNISKECAERCAQYLLENAIEQKNTLAWNCHNLELARGNLTGFAHGASGIGWALIRLGCYTNQTKYIEAGKAAFAYETTQFDPKKHNWYDLRTSLVTKGSTAPKFSYFWCSGAAGIGLSRIHSWMLLGKKDKNMLNEARIALNAVLRNFHKLSDDSLCHGISGNSEFLLSFARLTGESYFQMEANLQATKQWQQYSRSHRWTCGAGGSEILPDLMTGLAGIGMHFLRLVYPDRIPSPLLLDPSPSLLF